MNTHTERTSAARMTVYPILFAISLGHFLNDAMQAVIPALFPILRSTMELSYAQIGWVAFALNMTSSVMQPAAAQPCRHGIRAHRRSGVWHGGARRGRARQNRRLVVARHINGALQRAAALWRLGGLAAERSDIANAYFSFNLFSL